jgi:hypothetical protein
MSNAISLQISPLFPHFLEELSSAFPAHGLQIIADPIATNTCTGEILDYLAASNHPSDLSTIIHDIEILSLVLHSLNSSDMTKVDQLMLSDRLYDIQRRTYNLIQAEFGLQSNPAPATNSVDSVKIQSSLYIAYCFTTLAYVSLALREIPPSARFFYMLVEHLTTVLQESEIVKACINYPKSLLWILGTGGAVALGRKQRGWYVEQLANFCEERKIFAWDAMREAFGDPMHLVPEYMKEFMDVWNDVEELRIMRDLE